jgi:hypothetical protein
MPRAVPIASQSDGINLLRSKGGAAPTGLFDLLNGYVTPKKTINARPGTVVAASFPAGSKGVVGFEGKYHTFATSALASSDPNVLVHVLKRSDNSTAALSRIHRAFPFLGRLYVVAEYDDGAVRHFYLESPAAHAASHVYAYGDRVTPAAGDNGFYYVIEDTDATAAWQAGATVAVNDFKQPTTANGFKYQATAIAGTGTNFLTSDTEPTWPTTEGATVTERRYITNPHNFPGSGVAGTGTSGTGSGTSGEYGPFPPTGTRTRDLSSGSA